ncbi:MAG TPA: GDSL-type esterase/lipase family protein [Candidatus Binatia bacterium]|jgi:lysophospholipase L1-like esterase
MRHALVAALASLAAFATSVPAQSPPAVWADAWGRSPLSTTVTTSSTTVQATTPATFKNQTLRLIVFPTLGGSRVRVKLTNKFSKTPLAVGAAHVAVRQSGGTIVAGTDRALTFGGASSVTIAAGAEVWSDPATLSITARTDLAISLYVPGTFIPTTFHPTGLKTSYLSKAGNFSASATMPAAAWPNPATTTTVFFVSDVQVLTPPDTMVLVALGDSITDGATAATNQNASWPDDLAKRFPGLADGTPVSVINMGIGSNRFCASDGAGPAGLHRLSDDVLSRPNVTHLILLEGINDISYEHVSAATLIACYASAIAQAHAAGVEVFMSPLLPIKYSVKSTPANEATREAVNAWIRATPASSGGPDALIDFEAAVWDPSDHLAIRSSLTTDHVHPNTQGYQAMANAIDLSLFK